MATNNSIVEAILEDKLADIWTDYLCLYDVRYPEFKNRELRDKAFQARALCLAWRRETQDFTHVLRLAALMRLRLLRSKKRLRKISSSSDELES